MGFRHLPLVRKILWRVFIQLVYWRYRLSDEEDSDHDQCTREYVALHLMGDPECPPLVKGAPVWSLRREEGHFRSDDVEMLFDLRGLEILEPVGNYAITPSISTYSQKPAET